MRFIGSKANLLEHIEAIINRNTNGDEETFLDLFSGTNVVGDYFKKDYTIYSNDMLYFSFVNAKAIIENNDRLTFKMLKEHGIEDPFDYLQREDQLDNSKTSRYYETSYTPNGGSKYLSVENGKRIDSIRKTIEEWNNNKLLTEYEYYYLLSSLVESIPFVSNITGTYGAYLKHWDKRALKKLELYPLKVVNNHKENKAFNEDANDLVKKLTVDIAYIDTPYNNRQYASNYHLLENVARNNQPELKGKTSIFDWSYLKSNYAIKRKALNTMSDLIENIDATHVVLSYNNEGIIPVEDLISLTERFAVDGNIEVERIPYRKYQSKKPSDQLDLYELLIYIQKKPLSQKKVKERTENFIEKWEAPTKKYIKSPLNYIGGKHRLLNQIIPLFPKKIDTFVDLFSGGANVGINVEASRHIFNDMNSRMNEMFRYFAKQSPNELIKKIKNRIEFYGLSKTNEEAFLQFRKHYNNNPNPLDLYILISYSYNYQSRFNNSMEFNNPFGRNRSCFSKNMENNLHAFVSKLKNINAEFSDYLFTDLDLSNLGENDFVYLDPPYLITTGNYNDGNRGYVNWSENQELAMYDLMNQLTHKGVRYALSNVIEHKGKQNYFLKSFIEQSNSVVHYLDFHYNNSSHNSKGTGSVEVLVTNYDPNTHKIIEPKNTELDIV